jgi:hypothetical protein
MGRILKARRDEKGMKSRVPVADGRGVDGREGKIK